IREVTDALVPRIRDYIALQLGARDAVLENVQRIAVGWSHETWLFDAVWRDGSTERRLGLCLRRDPGNALLRHLSTLETQFRVLQCLERTGLATPKAYWFEDDVTILHAPLLVMAKGV